MTVLVAAMGFCLVAASYITIAKPAGTFYAKYLILLYAISLVIAGLAFFKLKDFFDVRFKIVFVLGLVVLFVPIAVILLFFIAM